MLNLQRKINASHIISRIQTKYEGIDELQASSFVNPYSYGILRQNFLDLEVVDKFYVDSALLAGLFRAFGLRVDRVSFDMGSIARDVLQTANHRELKVALIGARTEEAKAAAAVLSNSYPDIKFCYVRSGYFQSEAEKLATAEALRQGGVGLAIIGMGAGKQESMLKTLRSAGFKGTIYTCGGFIHQTAEGRLYYYPHVINRLHLRWLYRAIKEPKVLVRLLRDYPKNLVLILIDLATNRDALKAIKKDQRLKP